MLINTYTNTGDIEYRDSETNHLYATIIRHPYQRWYEVVQGPDNPGQWGVVLPKFCSLKAAEHLALAIASEMKFITK